MARIYLEATELASIATDAEFIRAEITGKTEVEVAEIKDTIKEIMSGLNYKLVRHICHHDVGNPCEEENEI